MLFAFWQGKFCCVTHYICNFFLFCFVFPPLSFEMMYILLIATYAVLKAHEKYIYIYIYK
jgi:hypothetical protein